LCLLEEFFIGKVVVVKDLGSRAVLLLNFNPALPLQSSIVIAYINIFSGETVDKRLECGEEHAS
jgi:hypothetical protein